MTQTNTNIDLSNRSINERALVAEQGPEGRIESQWARVWRNFRRNRLAKVGGAITIIFIVLSVFAPFFSPYDYTKPTFRAAYVPPQRIRFIDAEGNFHWRPFVYKLKTGMDPETWERVYLEDTSKRFSIKFFVRGWEYTLIPGVKSNLHLFGVEDGGTIHLLGTDKMGRDLLSRIFFGGRVSLLIALSGALVSAVVGSIIGATSGYYGGKVDMLIQRLIELLQSFPQLPLWMALSVAIPPDWPPMGIAVGVILMFSLLSWTWLAREVRGKVLSYRDQEFVVAARGIGAKTPYVIIRHVLPNVLSHIIVVMTINIPELILAESSLSFLGLGIQPPMVSWGVLLNDATNLEAIGMYPWLLVPGFVILVVVLGFNFLGDGLRDAVDPFSI